MSYGVKAHQHRFSLWTGPQSPFRCCLARGLAFPFGTPNSVLRDAAVLSGIFACRFWTGANPVSQGSARGLVLSLAYYRHTNPPVIAELVPYGFSGHGFAPSGAGPIVQSPLCHCGVIFRVSAWLGDFRVAIVRGYTVALAHVIQTGRDIVGRFRLFHFSLCLLF